MDMTTKDLDYLIKHVFLPPELPQKDDASSEADAALCARVVEAGNSFSNTLVSTEERQKWATVMKMLRQLEYTQQTMEGLAESMGNMLMGDTIVVPVPAQNAAVIFHKKSEGTIVECSEVDPPNSVIMGTIGRVLCSYPHSAIGFPNTSFDDPSFLRELASFLANMAVDKLPDSEAFTKKAGTKVTEFRDSASGHYITHLLPAILRGYEGTFVPDVHRTTKRVRNEILWKNARAPWRRNPLWLIMRIAIQSALRQDPGPTENLYKLFTVHFMAKILQTATDMDVSGELLFCMRAKIARRVAKLSSVLPRISSLARNASDAATQLLDRRWQTIQSTQKKSPHWDPATFDLERDTRLTLPNSKAYIEQRIAQQGLGTAVPQVAQPSEPPRVCCTTDFRSLTSATLQSAFSRDRLDRDVFLALADFEASVQNHIDAWVSVHREESDCEVLATCIREYDYAASSRYKEDPESQSLRFLTIFDLWVALDRVALFNHPELSDYSPEIPLDILEPLLIRKALSFERVKAIHCHLRYRHGAAIFGRSVFTDDTGSHTFAARYFAHSEELQHLHSEITADAEKSCNAKIVELEKAKRGYQALLAEARALGACDYKQDRWGRQKHSGKCRKCNKQHTAARMKIAVHEWPLPSEAADAHNVVFELHLPNAFRVWRDITAMILGDICAVQKPKAVKMERELHKYTALMQYLPKSYNPPRVTLASSTKPFVVSHYREVKVSTATTDDVCKPNGLRYRLFDIRRLCWAAASFTQSSLSDACTPKLSVLSPYFPSAVAIASTRHTPNFVIASQDQARASLNLHEHMSFTGLRSGGRLQWLNIARELRMRILSFHHTEVHTLVAQAASQIGPISSQESAEWHIELNDPAFGDLLLVETGRLLSDVEDNWSNATTVQTIVLLVCRLLMAAHMHTELVVRGCNLLREARRVTYSWMRDLVTRLQSLTDDEMTIDFQTRICTVAAVCRATYDVDPVHFDHVLSNDDDISKIIECSIIIHDNCPSRDVDVTGPLRTLLLRDRRFSHSVESALKVCIQNSRTGLDKAILTEWPGYHPHGPWVFSTGQNQCWARTTAASITGANPQIVDLNIRDGRFLVDGKPLGRLPEGIVSHDTYVRLFKKRILDVIPSQLPGMDFATRQSIFGAQMHFHLTTSRELIVQAQRDSFVYELIPHRKFDGDLPAFLIQDYTHWIQLVEGSRSTLELRPCVTWWETNAANWRIDSCSWQMSRDNLLMVDIHSLTFAQCFDRVAALEERRYVSVAVNRRSGESHLQVALPRYTLSFFVNRNEELESVDLRSMVVDSDQSAGTFFGLSRQLALRAKDPNATQSTHPTRRMIVVPFGNLVPRRSTHHVTVDVEVCGTNLRYFMYEINTDLGQLKSTTLTADLYKILLHAYTSHLLIDPLTGRTGTEEALSELASARSFSFQDLGAEDRRLLKEIASLGPCREFYPQDLKVMETVTWGAIWPMAQHHAFPRLVNSILDFAEDLLVFQPTTSLAASPVLNRGYEHLHLRFASETSKLFPVESAHFTHGPEHDGEYSPPIDIRLSSATKESRLTAASHATETAALVQAWPSRLPTVVDIRQRVESWQGVSADMTRPLVVSYNKSFLESEYLQPVWCQLYTQLQREQTSVRSSKLTFTLAAIAYQLHEYRYILPTLLSFASVGSAFQQYACPNYPGHVYHFGHGLVPAEKDLKSYLHGSVVPLEASTFANATQNYGETADEFYSRCYKSYTQTLDSQVTEAVEHLLQQWPCETPSMPSFGNLLRPSGFREQVMERFLHCFRNRVFHEHLGKIQTILSQCRGHVVAISIQPYQLQSIHPQSRAAFRPPALSEFVKREPATSLSSSLPVPRLELRSAGETPNPSTIELQKISRRLAEYSLTSSAELRRLYVDAIETSRKKLDSQNGVRSFLAPATDKLQIYHIQCRDAVVEVLQSITAALQFHPALRQAGQSPRINARSLLSQLCLVPLHPRWKDKLVALAQSFVRLQRSQRLLRFSWMSMAGDLNRELANYAFEEEEAFRHPEWLLIQIDNNFIVRPIQGTVAREMMTPSSGDNTISQLNMGEGKTTVIVPLITSLLADGETLARVIVLKQLAVQMFHIMRNALSGLLNRRIFFFPFSRDVQLRQAADAQKMQSLFESCMTERGVWIAQPEHILSFKLMGLDLMLDAAPGTENPVSSVLLHSQRWLNHNVRDILDESDEILNVAYQLVYTSGRQAPLDDHPDRWTTIQGILSHVHELAQDLAERFPAGIDIQRPETVTAFHSSIRILSEEAGNYLVQRIGEEILQSNDYRLLPREVKEDLFHYITQPTPSISLKRLRETCEPTALWNGILLRRGILAGGILVFALRQKRWRVNYGLDSRRTMLAVPYKAKDVPSLRTDFGHPDVAIILTCLSYYYGGLTEQQLDVSLELLLALDNPALEYELWVRNDAQIPPVLREVMGINLEDMDQRRRVINPRFCRNLAVVNFYLRQVVFPKEAKQFPYKLSTSAWDLAERKKHFTTGFSGTNDGQYLLPTSIAQRDPLVQLSTAAKVLSYILQPESKIYHCLPTGCSTKDFMNLLIQQTPEIRVLLDVGAQMLQMQNKELAYYWLSNSSAIKAVVYFDSSDRMMVMARDGRSELLISSSFANGLEDCAVYLDDVHTRGTDLKLPLHTRAALTLGPGVTKDRLVQGAMRLRQLGQGQSVMFFAPPEVDLSIRTMCELPAGSSISSSNVVQWVMLQTISSIDHAVAYWANQGVNHKKRHAAWSRFEEDPTNSVEGLRSTWVERESRTLQEMYDFCDSDAPTHKVFDVPDMAQRLRDLGFSHILDASQDEEQEREVAQETERERQVERPPAATPAVHETHVLVRKLAETGILEIDPQVFVPPFSAFPALNKNAKWSTRILATRDFATTITARGHPKDYIRPLTWIISTSFGKGYLIFISPWEADELLPTIRSSQYVHLHQYAPRTMASMRSFEDLDFYTLPTSRAVPDGRWSPSEITQLNIFAGQLYLRDLEEYQCLCNILGLYVNDQISGDGSPVQYEGDGFVEPANRRGTMAVECLFEESPLSAVKDLVGWRRKGLSYRPTHMGKILHADLLRKEDFASTFFPFTCVNTESRLH